MAKIALNLVFLDPFWELFGEPLWEHFWKLFEGAFGPPGGSCWPGAPGASWGSLGGPFWRPFRDPLGEAFWSRFWARF